MNSLGPRCGIGCIVAFSVPISTVQRKENHYSNRGVDELDEQKVNFKSQPNKEKSYCTAVVVIMDPPVRYIQRILTLDHFLRQDEDDFNFF